MCRLSWAARPRVRPATTRLAARRLRSNSNGPWRVSSKSLMSNRRSRSGEANRPKLARCASPHSWVDDAGARTRAEVRGHGQRGTAQERERRDRHAAVPDRHQLRDPGPGLVLEERHRIRAVRAPQPRRPGWRAGSRAGPPHRRPDAPLVAVCTVIGPASCSTAVGASVPTGAAWLAALVRRDRLRDGGEHVRRADLLGQPVGIELGPERRADVGHRERHALAPELLVDLAQ